MTLHLKGLRTQVGGLESLCATQASSFRGELNHSSKMKDLFESVIDDDKTIEIFINKEIKEMAIL